MNNTSPTPRVAAIFATMNRHATAVHCIRALASQTTPPAFVIVADNASTDQTPEILEALQNLPFPLHVLRMGYNSGNAGGVKATMEFAFGKQADAVWILDDDSFPRERALGALLDGFNPAIVRHPLQINPNTGRFTWPLMIRLPANRDQLAWDEDAMGQQRVLETKSAWTGALVSHEIYEKTGPVNEDLFIRGEDEEYPWRIANQGYHFELVRDAVLDHVGPERLIHWSISGRNFFIEKGLPDWKLYYKVRNMVWLKCRQGGLLGALAMAAAYILGVLATDGIGRLKILLMAVRDGFTSKLGPLPDEKIKTVR
jgi:rhamnopyranosyl-N-acetylglucosaminyl-diphospho-decaprenol beta-1,3/1,4-galactofuranosyltransferase